MNNFSETPQNNVGNTLLGKMFIKSVRYKIEIRKLDKIVPPTVEEDLKTWLIHKALEVGTGSQHEYFGYTDDYKDDIGVSFYVSWVSLGEALADTINKSIDIPVQNNEKYKTELREKQLVTPVIIPHISHFVDDNGYLYDNQDQDILIENENGIIKFYKIDFDYNRNYLKAIYVV